MGDAVAVTVTCPTCGSVWETASRSGRTRCPNRHRVYVPAATRSGPRASSPRAASRAPTSAPAPATAERITTADDTQDTTADDTRPTEARRSRRPVPYASSAPVQSAPIIVGAVPAPVRAAIGAVGRWSCGHVGTLVSATTAREPAGSRCRECGAVGLVAQLTPGGWAPVAVEDPAPEQPRAETGRRPSRPVVPARFAGLVSPSAWPGETGWQPVEDRRPHGPADLVAVPRLRSSAATPGRRDVVPGTYPST